MERPCLVAQHFSNSIDKVLAEVVHRELKSCEGCDEESVWICFELMGANFYSHFVKVSCLKLQAFHDKEARHQFIKDSIVFKT